MASPYEISSLEEDLLEHSFDVRFNIVQLIPPHHMTISSPLFESADAIIIDQVIQQSMLQAVSMVPASENAIASLKKVHVTRERCSICLENFEEDDDGVLGMPCQHVYHKDCIVQWLKTSHMCPLCRFKMPVQ